MLNILGKMFGSSDVINKSMDLIDDAFTSEIELLEANTEAQIKLVTAKTEAKTNFINSMSGYKIAQRYLMLLFCIPFVFLLCVGILSALFGLANLEDVETAIGFANKLWLGEIVVLIVTFYFGGGLAESIKRRVK